MKLIDLEKYRTGNIVEAKVNVSTPLPNNVNTFTAPNLGHININILAHECNVTLYTLLKDHMEHQICKPRKPLFLGKKEYRSRKHEWELVEKKFEQILSKVDITFLDEVI